MIVTGVIRRIDDLGRIHISKEVRKMAFGTANLDGIPMEIGVSKNGEIIIRKADTTENN